MLKGFLLFSACSTHMRQPMTPQHDVYSNHSHHGLPNSGQPRAYSYTSNTTQAAYSVPIMPSQGRVFFPDDLDTSSYHLFGGPSNDTEATDDDVDNDRPTTPTLPHLENTASTTSMIQLSSVPTHKYQNQPQMSHQHQQLQQHHVPQPHPPATLPQLSITVDEPPLFRNPQAPPPPSKKFKKKPDPIMIPSVCCRIDYFCAYCRLKRFSELYTPLSVYASNQPLAPPFTPAMDKRHVWSAVHWQHLRLRQRDRRFDGCGPRATPLHPSPDALS